jgi:hypothetical protein
MAYEIFDGTDMIGEFFGKGQGVTYETGDALPQRVIETLDMIGFPGVLRDGFVLCRRNDPCVDGIWIGIERRLLTVPRRQIRPQLLRTLVTAIPDVERHDLPGLFVHGDPDPLFVGLCFHKAPHLVRFHLKTPNEHIPGRGHGPSMQMVRQHCKAGDHKVHEPLDTDANGAANAMGCGRSPDSACPWGLPVVGHAVAWL